MQNFDARNRVFVIERALRFYTATLGFKQDWIYQEDGRAGPGQPIRLPHYPESGRRLTAWQGWSPGRVFSQFIMDQLESFQRYLSEKSHKDHSYLLGCADSRDSRPRWE